MKMSFVEEGFLCKEDVMFYVSSFLMAQYTIFDSKTNLPLVNISWNDAQEHIRKLNLKTGLNFRLPTEIEWEYASTGGRHSNTYLYSGSNILNDVGWFVENTKVLQPVGLLKPNELGLYDMSGNVWEWCWDWYGDYPKYVVQNYQGLSKGSTRVLRGGSWNLGARNARVSYRLYYSPAFRGYFIGFRLVLDYDSILNNNKFLDIYYPNYN